MYSPRSRLRANPTPRGLAALVDGIQDSQASQARCASATVGRTQFARAVFNLLAANQDDHTRNWAFLQDDDGKWRPAPFYDVTFSPSPRSEHTTAFLGHGTDPPLGAMQQLAAQANFADWRQAHEAVDRVAEVISRWDRVAANLGVTQATRRLIQRRHNEIRARNKALIAPSRATQPQMGGNKRTINAP